MGVLVICRSPGPIVVEGRTAFTIGAGGVVLTDTDIVDLEKGPPAIRNNHQRDVPEMDLPSTQPPPNHHSGSSSDPTSSRLHSAPVTLSAACLCAGVRVCVCVCACTCSDACTCPPILTRYLKSSFFALEHPRDAQSKAAPGRCPDTLTGKLWFWKLVDPLQIYIPAIFDCG